MSYEGPGAGFGAVGAVFVLLATVLAVIVPFLAVAGVIGYLAWKRVRSKAGAGSPEAGRVA